MSRPKHTRLAAARARGHRSAMTVAEARLWSGIRRKAVGARFRRQVPIGSWIVDFASLNPKLVIEVDDRSHDWRDESARTAFLEGAGFAILRFANAEIRDALDECISTVELWVSSLRANGRSPE